MCWIPDVTAEDLFDHLWREKDRHPTRLNFMYYFTLFSLSFTYFHLFSLPFSSLLLPLLPYLFIFSPLIYPLLHFLLLLQSLFFQSSYSSHYLTLSLPFLSHSVLIFNILINSMQSPFSPTPHRPLIH